MFWSAGCSLLRAESFSCSLGVLYGGLGISKLQFLIKKIKIKFPAVNFSNFRSLTLDPGSGSAIRISNWKKCWIRIRIKSMRIRNPVLLSDQFLCNFNIPTLWLPCVTELFLEIFTAMTELRALDRTGTIREHVKKTQKSVFSSNSLPLAVMLRYEHREKAFFCVFFTCSRIVRTKVQKPLRQETKCICYLDQFPCSWVRIRILNTDPDQGQENKCGSMWIQIQIHNTGYRGSFSYDFDHFRLYYTLLSL